MAPPASPVRTLVTDVSTYQDDARDLGVADLARIAEHDFFGHKLAAMYARATIAFGVDKSFAGNAKNAPGVGLDFGGYHAFHPGSGDPERQAIHFHKVVHDQCKPTLAPMLDVEVARHVTTLDLVARARALIEATRELWKCEPWFYTYPFFLLGGWPEDFKRSPLWIAHYHVKQPMIPEPWTTWLMHQFDGDGGWKFPTGVDADFNFFAGTREELRALGWWSEATTDPGSPDAKKRSTDRMPAVGVDIRTDEPPPWWHPVFDARPFIATLAEDDDKT